MNKTILSWILRGLAAVLFLQTLPFKFSGAAESVALFSELGAEPWGRFLTGALELVAAILLLIPQTATKGAALGVALMLGALGSHAAILGFAGDRGTLALLAVVALVACAGTLFLHRDQIHCPICKRVNKARGRC